MTNKLKNIITLLSIFIIFSNKTSINNNLEPSISECKEGCYKVKILFVERCVCPPTSNNNLSFNFII